MSLLMRRDIGPEILGADRRPDLLHDLAAAVLERLSGSRRAARSRRHSRRRSRRCACSLGRRPIARADGWAATARRSDEHQIGIFVEVALREVVGGRQSSRCRASSRRSRPAPAHRPRSRARRRPACRTLSCRMSFLALVTSTSGLPWSSSTMKVTLAPPSSPLCSSRYIWKPLTMSVPSCVKMPVRGARNPILSSCACAGINAPNAHAAARHSGNIRAKGYSSSFPPERAANGFCGYFAQRRCILR